MIPGNLASFTIPSANQLGVTVGQHFTMELPSSTRWLRSIAPALAAGCTVVAKACSSGHHMALSRMGEGIISEGGIPNGVVNVCPGQGVDAGDAYM